MQIVDIGQLEGRSYPAGRRTRPFIGAALPIVARHFCMGLVELSADGGQIPWHNQSQEEVYLVLEGTCEMCLGGEREVLTGGQAVYIPPGVFHQLTNIGATTARMLYCYAPAGEVSHWREELDGSLPRAGKEAPPLPAGSRPQHV